MSQYSNWFLATPSDAVTIAQDENASDHFQELSLKGVLQLEFTQLAKLLGLPSYRPRLLYQNDEDGPIVLAVPLEFISALANVSDHERLASNWIRVSEYLEEKGIEEVKQDLARMIEYAREALRSRKAILELVTT